MKEYAPRCSVVAIAADGWTYEKSPLEVPRDMRVFAEMAARASALEGVERTTFQVFDCGESAGEYEVAP